MTYVEFNDQLTRMRASWGDKAFPEEKVKLLWKMVAFVSQDQFQQVVDYLILNNKFAPAGNDFLEALEGLKNRYSSSGITCEKCSNSGWCDVWETWDGQHIAERCSCCGGPDNLARSIETAQRNPDPDLAKRIRLAFTAEGKSRMKKLTKAELQRPND